MFRSLITATTLILASAPAVSADCTELGLSTDFLTKFYCKELQAITNGKGPTRGYGENTSSTTDPAPDASWGDIKILKEAYRADPSKTLALIKRIKNAGGLTDE